MVKNYRFHAKGGISMNKKAIKKLLYILSNYKYLIGCINKQQLTMKMLQLEIQFKKQEVQL